MMTTQIDNGRLDHKLLLRRHFLTRYHHKTPPRVLDCCQGSGLLWTELRKDYELRSYWGLDIKPKPGRMAIHSERILELPGWEADIVDVDTYGAPWKHWRAILRFGPLPLTVFLTVGQVSMGGTQLSHEALQGLGLIFPTMKVTPGLMAKVQDLVIPHQLTLVASYDRIITESKQICGSRNVTYLGLRLEAAHGR